MTGRLRTALLRPYYLLAFYYHLRMYKRAVRKVEEGKRRVGGDNVS